MADQITTFSFGPRNPRGVCSECGQPAYDGRATKCETHRKSGKSTGPSRVTPDVDQIRIERPGPPPKVPVPTDEKTVRALVLQKSIEDDLNPVLVQGFAMLCQPIPSENFYTIVEDPKGIASTQIQYTPLGKSMCITGVKASMLAKGLVELEKSPVSVAAEAYMKPFLPVVYGIMALGVVGIHGYQMITVRDQLMRSYNAQLAAQAGTAPAAEQAAQATAQTAYGVPDINPDLAPPPDTGPTVDDLPNVSRIA